MLLGLSGCSPSRNQVRARLAGKAFSVAVGDTTHRQVFRDQIPVAVRNGEIPFALDVFRHLDEAERPVLGTSGSSSMGPRQA